ncbi:MAG: NUDIX domain-containing protein [Ornithinimicrobium sp.]|uniref:NUDIX hydrolase n=1 Tax=Ornithinimicrobium sp. TaxID=1977084 RepID=UPI0026DF5ABF|nr:NUDIX domain-containing protein [Ornithinimicrobium sp.]MDO5740059.1 NUDIX domain-containing protein [Ornithinimicrobium sp.]
MAYTSQYPPFFVTVDLVILTISDGAFSVLLVERGGEPFRGRWALPGGFVQIDEDLADAAYRELEEETGVGGDAVHLEQLATFGAPGRDPRDRIVSTAYLAVGAHLPQVQGGSDAADARWWTVEKALSEQLAFDHREILETGVERTRSKLEYTDLALRFVPPRFTMPELQAVYEAVWGAELDPRNFARKVVRTQDFVRETEEERRGGRGRPAKLYVAGGAVSLWPPMSREQQGER